MYTASLPDSVVDSDGEPDFIDVEVIYAEPQGHALVRLRLPTGSTLRQAIEASGLVVRFPEIDLARNRLGIYGKIATADTRLASKDRIEIYRPLIANPKESRKRRAAAGLRPGKGRKHTS